jgi:hypothetical protein
LYSRITFVTLFFILSDFSITFLRALSADRQGQLQHLRALVKAMRENHGDDVVLKPFLQDLPFWQQAVVPRLLLMLLPLFRLGLLAALYRLKPDLLLQIHFQRLLL